jgi:trk system potassium uptake protein TrkA
MRIIIVGAGEVGYQIAKFLSLESLNVVVIDKNRDKLKRIADEVDIAVVEGEGGNPSTLQKAGADKADILLAVTNRDETNMIACLLAKAMFGIPRKIARIRNPEYFNNEKILRWDNLDIDPAINPELELAKAIVRLLEVPFASDVEEFEEGLVKVVGFKIPEKSPVIGKSLQTLGSSLERKFLIGLIVRGDITIIPDGSDVIERGDIVYVPVKKKDVEPMISMFGGEARAPRKVMILGGGRIGYHVASVMEQKTDVKIIEKDHERCKFLSENLKRALVLHADGAEQNVLKEENIDKMDVFVAVSNNDELNIMVSLIAKNLGVRNTIAIVNKTDFMPLAYELGLQAVLSPRLITASTILRYVRKGEILSLTTIATGKAEIIEGRIRATSPLRGKTLDTMRLKGCLIGSIIRDKEVIIPSGTDKIHESDRLIIFTLRESVREVEKLLS